MKPALLEAVVDNALVLIGGGALVAAAWGLDWRAGLAVAGLGCMALARGSRPWPRRPTE